MQPITVEMCRCSLQLLGALVVCWRHFSELVPILIAEGAGVMEHCSWPYRRAATMQ
jgi:hypothetical protein